MDTHTKTQLDNLLRTCGMTADVTDLATLAQLFSAQMRVSLYGGVSSIPMLPTFLKPFGPLTENCPVAVAELTEEEVKVSLVTFTGGKPQFSDEDSFPIPGREYPAPLEDLLYAAAELLEPLLDRAKAIALCLSYPVDFDGKGDGSVRSFPGVMSVSDYKDVPLLATLRAELESREIAPLPMVLIPEVDAVLLAGGTSAPKGSRSLGLLWGENIDVGFAAPGSIVLRWLGIPGDLMLFDGGFSSAQCVPFGMGDFAKDRDCYAPGLDLYRKIVSTDYLGDTYRIVMIKAAEAKLLSFGCSRDVLSLRYLTLEAVVDFLNDPVNGGTIAHFCREPEDREVGLYIAKAVLDRAARLVCANLSAVLSFAGAGKTADTPAWVGVSGTAFRIPVLRELLEEHLNEFTRGVMGLHLSLCDGENMPAAGAAAAALYQYSL